MSKKNQEDTLKKNKNEEENKVNQKNAEQANNADKGNKDEDTQQQKDEPQEESTKESSENLDKDDTTTQNNDSSEEQQKSQSEEPQKSEEEQLKDDLQEQKDKYMRLVAEFENYKKRTSKERLDLFKSANREVIQALLPVVDDFDRAIKEIEKQDSKHFEGIKLIHNKLNDTLKSQGLTKINVKEGDKFDADIHEAVTQVPAPKPELKGKIVDIVEKGYSLGEKVLRFPKVVTGK